MSTIQHTLQRAYKTELALNNAQITEHAGAARWAYNWGLARKQEAYHVTGTSPTAIDLHRDLNALKQTEISWLYEVSKCAPQEALRNLDSAFSHFFRRCQLKQHGRLKGKVGYPQRKTKKRGLGSFRLTGSIVVCADAIQLPRLGRLRLKERDYLPTQPKIRSATVSEQAGHWSVSVLVQQDYVAPVNCGPMVGVDLGVKTLATLSDGTTEPNPRHLRSCLKKLKRLQRTVSHRQKGGCNRTKAVRRLGRLHRKVANQRTNTLHQITSRLAKTKSVVVIEELHVAGMLKNHHLAQAIGDVGFGAFRRQLAYKAAWYGCWVLVASRWEPSSKTCSGCGQVLDRDLNAAINLVNVANVANVATLAGSSSERQNACGEESAGWGLTAQVQLSPLKQEPNTFDASAENGKFWRTEVQPRLSRRPGWRRGDAGDVAISASRARSTARCARSVITSLRIALTASALSHPKGPGSMRIVSRSSVA
jgi:putative transposase